MLSYCSLFLLSFLGQSSYFLSYVCCQCYHLLRALCCHRFCFSCHPFPPHVRLTNKYKETRCCDAHPSPCHSFHTDFRVTLLFIFSFGMPTMARCGASDAELTQLLWNTAGVKSSLILRHKGPKYGVHLDSDGWASISRGGRMR